MINADVLTREIHTKSELQNVINEETGRTDVVINEYALIEDTHTHPVTNKEFSLWRARANVTVAGVDWSVEKDGGYISVADASNAIVAYIENICCADGK